MILSEIESIKPEIEDALNIKRKEDIPALVQHFIRRKSIELRLDKV